MATSTLKSEERAAARRPFSVPFRIIPLGRPSDVLDGETIDVSRNGVGVKLGRGGLGRAEAALEMLVEDRVAVELVLRLPEGAVSVSGQLMWWGVLGDDERFSLRAGVLLRSPWSEADWRLVERNLDRS